MKPATPGRLKFKKLQKALDLPLWQVIGILESLWYVTATNTPAGDIGRLSNSDIALAMDYEGDADELIRILTEQEWLDASEDHRLVVHDWHEHAASYLKGSFKAQGLTFASEGGSKGGSKTPSKDGSESALTSPSLSSPSQERTPPAIAGFDRFWAAYPVKKAKQDALKAWKKLKPTEELLAKMLKALVDQHAERNARAAAGAFLPDWKHPATWLNKGCWEDVPASVQKPGAKPTPSMHEDADAKRKRETLDLARYEQRRLKLDAQRPQETDDAFIARINREAA